MIKITSQEIGLLSSYIFEISGIQLDQSKGYLLESRLQPLLSSHGFKTFGEIPQKAKADRSGNLKSRIIDAITINETYFFRDNTPFELMKNKIVPDLIDLRRREYGSSRFPLRIWSAACSTGQEVYSAAITLLEMLSDRRSFDIRILGTDISEEAVAKASYGKYNPFEVDRGLAAPLRHKYFTQMADGWRIKDEVRSLAKFSRMDLTQPFSALGKFDLVFCRNVAIYFSQPGKVKLFQKIAKVLNPGGVLIVGGSETLSGISRDFEAKHYLKGLFYQTKTDEETTAPDKRDEYPSPRKTPPQKSRRPEPPKSPMAKDKETARHRAAIDEKIIRKQVESKKVDPIDSPKKEAPIPQKTQPPEQEKPKSQPDTAPISLEEKLARPKATNKKGALLTSLQQKKQKESSSLLEKKTGKETQKGSLLDRINKKR
ncbi:MAG: methyltransferase domain-containing protein [Proteobacteria bacterium]|nr:methyltransferase domain-containing protein [Pseudomonadota bacterium]